MQLLTNWAESVRDGTIASQNETQLEGDFKSRILETVLGYDSFGTGRPQTIKAKFLMGVQSSIALMTIGLAIARVVNILK